ncbi:MAG: 5-carboxymethyl-2-hydroxymuconate isomerase [Alteromonadaceae bacterium]|jgi:5-carboxymethyl-2-hydroxymuconate isomerase
MPHCIIEYAKNIEHSVTPQQLLNAVFQGTAKSQLFYKDTDIKTRAIAYEHYQIGAKKDDFVHVTIKILSGRTLTQRQHLSSLVLDALSLLNFNDTSLTIEVIDMEKDSYTKKLT